MREEEFGQDARGKVGEPSIGIVESSASAEIRQALEDATTVSTVKAIADAMWRAYGTGSITETEGEALSAIVEMRKTTLTALAQAAAEARATAKRAAASKDAARRGSRPRSDGSLERRRRWAASGKMPPALAARYTLAEQAVLAVVAAEVKARGDCRLPIDRIAAEAGVCATVVRNALREARVLGHLTIEERRLSAWRSDTNVVSLVSPEWLAWLRLGRDPGAGGGGCKSVKPTSMKEFYWKKAHQRQPSQGLPKGMEMAAVALDSNPAEGR